MFLHIYLFMCVCVCVCVRVLIYRFKRRARVCACGSMNVCTCRLRRVFLKYWDVLSILPNVSEAKWLPSDLPLVLLMLQLAVLNQARQMPVNQLLRICYEHLRALHREPHIPNDAKMQQILPHIYAFFASAQELFLDYVQLT